jgi:hydroxyacylglutathione hydrolase
VVKIIPVASLKDNYIWMLVNHQDAIIVDPGESSPVQSYLEQHQLSLRGILITHHHWDHTNGLDALLAAFNTNVYGPKNETVKGMTHPVCEGDVVSFQDFPAKFNVLDIPGHTLGHIAYYANGNLFCGDTLFAAGCGRLFEGTAEQLYASLQKIAKLPDDTFIYCAHEYTLNNLRFAQLVEPNNEDIKMRMQRVQTMRDKQLSTLPSTLAEEKLTNPFLRCDSAEVIKQTEKQAGKRLVTSVDVFSALRQWKDSGV